MRVPQSCPRPLYLLLTESRRDKAGQCRRQTGEGTGHGPGWEKCFGPKREPPRVARSFPSSQKEPNCSDSVPRASGQDSQKTKTAEGVPRWGQRRGRETILCSMFLEASTDSQFHLSTEKAEWALSDHLKDEVKSQQGQISCSRAQQGQRQS